MLNEDKIVKKEDLVYPELSYQIVGTLFDVYNQVGYGHDEKIYQKAVAVALKKLNLKFKEQLYSPLIYEDQKVGSYYFDFLIENKIVLEIKKGDKFFKTHIEQVYKYLVSQDIKLGILAYFAPRKLHYKRIVNINN